MLQISNSDLHRDLNISLVTEEITKNKLQHEKRRQTKQNLRWKPYVM